MPNWITLAEWLRERSFPKLEKLARRYSSTSSALSEILCNLDQYTDEELSKAWDKDAKAGDEYYAERMQIMLKSGLRWAP